MIRVAIVGTGSIANMHITELLAFPECRIVALCDIYPQKAEAMKEKYQLDCEVYDDHRTMLESGTEIDLVHICTPPYVHCEIAVNSMNAGCNVVVEKPMATCLAECDEMLEAEKRNSVTMACIAQNRFRNSIYKLKKAEAVKKPDSRFRVGGPAICGVQDELWIRSFMEFCRREQLPLDFVTRHHYTTDFPERAGHYGYAALSDAEEGFANLQSTRDIIDSFEEYKGMEIHIAEFNTSYIPNCPLHDTDQNAAYIAWQLSRLGDVNESYSYWTFGDIFEENGVPFIPFHGGFGLVANGGIPKPTF